MLFIVAGLCLALVYILAIDSMFVSWIVAVCSTVVFIFLYTMVTVYFHSCNQIFFEDTLMAAERKRNKKTTTIKNIEEVKTTVTETKDSVEEKNNKVEEKKEEQKVKKSNTTKKQTTKTTKSTKKSPTKKITNKK